MKIEGEGVAPLLMRVPNAARSLGISRSGLYRLIRSGDLKIVKIGRRSLIPAADVRALVERLTSRSQVPNTM